MVGRRGEAPLVPPYRLHSPNKAMAVGSMIHCLSKFAVLGIVRPTFGVGEFGLFFKANGCLLAVPHSSELGADDVLGSVRHPFNKDNVDGENCRATNGCDQFFQCGEVVCAWSHELRACGLRRFGSTAATTESGGGRTRWCSWSTGRTSHAGYGWRSSHAGNGRRGGDGHCWCDAPNGCPCGRDSRRGDSRWNSGCQPGSCGRCRCGNARCSP